MEALALIDGGLAGFSPAMRAALWGALSGAAGMGLYALAAPQAQLRQCKAAQKEHKNVLRHYDGDFNGLKALIRADLGYSLTQIRLSVLPFLLSMGPLIGLMIGLEALYAPLPFATLGAAWTASFEFWFLLAAVAVSLAVKFIFKIT